jgi:hypothetical protein
MPTFSKFGFKEDRFAGELRAQLGRNSLNPLSERKRFI